VARELRRWGPPGLRVQILGTRADRLDLAGDAVVVNYDLLLSDALFEQLLERAWSLLILDESHLLRTPTAERTRRVLGRSPCLASSAQRVIALTGTPIINTPLDLYPLINRLFPRAIAIDGRRMQLHEFAQHFCTFRTVRIGGGRTIQQPVGGQNLSDLRARLAPHTSRLRRVDVLDLPKLRLNEFALAVDAGEALLAETALPAALRAAIVDAVQAGNADALLGLLRQYAPALATLRRLLGALKGRPAAEHIAERLTAGEDRVVAFFHHRAVSDLIRDHLHGASIASAVIRGDTSSTARAKAIDAFDAGHLPVLLLQNHAGSLGLNLQLCRYAAVVEQDWTDAITRQAIGRLYRAGQQRDVVVEFLVVAGSIDEHIAQAARRKAAIADDIIEQSEA
jgi:SNF2 family DNA or RNA helicase